MSRYNPQGQVRAYWVTDAIPSPAAPVLATITGGTRLDQYMVPDGTSGFTAEGATVDVTDLAATREKTVPGLATVTNGSMTFFRGDDPADGESVLLEAFKTDHAAKEDGYIVFVLAGAPLATGLADVHPAQINSVNADTPTGGTGGRWMVTFTHPAESVLNAVIAAT